MAKGGISEVVGSILPDCPTFSKSSTLLESQDRGVMLKLFI